MITHETHIRVRYADTDQMGYVYYGKYAEYFEVGRVELIRSLGMTYKSVEEGGIIMPVVDLHIQYQRPAHYDELLRVRTTIPEIPRSSFLTTYEVFNEAGQLLVSGAVKLAFIDTARNRPVRAPEYIRQAVETHWTPS